jgi:hypothetical protein
MGALGSNRVGRALIDFMGHMHADPQLTVRVGKTTFASPVGLGWRVDPEGRAARALLRFGVGCIERRGSGLRSVMRGAGRTLCDGPMEAGATVANCLGDGVLLTRREAVEGSEVVMLPSGEVWPVVAWDDDAVSAEQAVAAGGVVLQVGVREAHGGWCVPAEMPGGLPERVRVWRERVGAQGGVIVAGGVAGPADAVALIEAGASLVLVDAGLVFNGPGLVKRCNAALLVRRAAAEVAGADFSVMRRSWFWAAALGLALAGGGVLALGLSFGRVLLPYDEQFLGMTAEVLRRNAPKLHAFMAHDRGTLAGVMLGLGWLYAVLAWRGIRHGVDGAKTAVVASAVAGFASFFSFLGFGYFDTLHAFVAAVLFQLTVQIMTGANGGRAPVAVPRDDENASCRWSHTTGRRWAACCGRRAWACCCRCCGVSSEARRGYGGPSPDWACRRMRRPWACTRGWATRIGATSCRRWRDSRCGQVGWC